MEKIRVSLPVAAVDLTSGSCRVTHHTLNPYSSSTEKDIDMYSDAAPVENVS